MPTSSSTDSRHRDLGLTDGEYDLIVQRLGREPGDTELAMLSLMWSEHCAYKHSRKLLRRLPTRVTESLMRLVDEADRKDIATLFQYGENTVGALMTTDYAWLPGTLTAAEAID